MQTRRSKHLLFSTIALVLGAVSFGCSKDDGPTAPVGGGGTVNTAFNSGLLNSGATFSHTFPATGVVNYVCTPHASMGMTGAVIINSGSSTANVNVTVGAGGGLSFDPDTVTIMPGGTVNWSWSSDGHTVTSGLITAASLPRER